MSTKFSSNKLLNQNFFNASKGQKVKTKWWEYDPRYMIKLETYNKI